MRSRRRLHPDPSGAAQRGALGMTPDEAVDALLDREIAPADLPEALALIAGDRDASERLERMRAMFDDLRAPVGGPDVSRLVLGEVGRRRRWLTPGLQRAVSAGRLALAACLLAGVATTLVVERLNPDALVFGGPQPTPLASVVDAGRQDAAIGIRQVGGLLDTSFLAHGREGGSAFVLGTLEPIDASGRILRFGPAHDPQPRVVDGLVIDLTGRDCSRSARPGGAPAEGVTNEETRWVLLPRSR